MGGEKTHGMHHGMCHGGHHGMGFGRGHGTGAGPNCHCGRQFLTSEEKIEMLERYREWLDSESKGVIEVIEKLKGKG